MTQYKPNFQVRNLRVLEGSNIVFETRFHSGLNIICGENSSGKSTILDFLFFALGGDLTEWRESSQRCTEVIVEILINNRPVTLSREVSPKKLRPMDIFLGNFEQAINAPQTEWKRYPYTRKAQKESFSQILFRWLGIPEVAGEADGKITLHQIMRLLYADQMTPIEHIFRFEQRDSPIVRQTVGDLLCGAYDTDLYSAQIRLIEAKKEHESATIELRSIYDVIGTKEHGLTLSWIESVKKDISEQLVDVQKQIEELEERIFHGEVSDGLSQEDQKQAYEELIYVQTELADARKEKDELELEILDSEKYISSLKSKLLKINDASLTAEALKSITFMYCPSCLAPLEETETSHACTLCKSPFNEESASSRIFGLINDISEQIKQSEKLQALRKTEIIKLEKKLVILNTQWEAINRQYTLANRTPSTELRTSAKKLHRKAGSLEQELVNLSEKEVLIGRIDELSKRKAGLRTEIERLTDLISAKRKEQKDKISEAYTKISDNTRGILQQDIDRQNTFQDAHNVVFSFGDNRLSVNNESFFSASSMVFFKNSFILALFKSALELASFRHPRFLIMDTIEDKGIEPERSHNFQMIMKDISEKSKVDHQLIYATSMIAPALKDSDYVVGEFYTHKKRSLKFTKVG